MGFAERESGIGRLKRANASITILQLEFIDTALVVEGEHW